MDLEKQLAEEKQKNTNLAGWLIIVGIIAFIALAVAVGAIPRA